MSIKYLKPTKVKRRHISRRAMLTHLNVESGWGFASDLGEQRVLEAKHSHRGTPVSVGPDHP